MRSSESKSEHLPRLPGGRRGVEHDDEARKHIISVLDVWVSLHDEGIAALVADYMQCLPLTHNIYLLARPATRQTPSGYYLRRSIVTDRAHQDSSQQDQCQIAAFDSPAYNLTASCFNATVKAGASVTDYIDAYDVILDVCYPQIVEQELRLKKLLTKKSMGVDVCMSNERAFYFNLPEVQRALHANTTALPYDWSMCSNILNYTDADMNINIVPLLKRIIRNQIPLWIFSGDQDSVIPLIGTRRIVRELAEDLKFGITVPYSAWFHKSQVGGWTTEYGKLLTYATVRGASHMVPYAQPDRALRLFRAFVNAQRLPATSDLPIDD